MPMPDDLKWTSPAVVLRLAFCGVILTGIVLSIVYMSWIIGANVIVFLLCAAENIRRARHWKRLEETIRLKVITSVDENRRKEHPIRPIHIHRFEEEDALCGFPKCRNTGRNFVLPAKELKERICPNCLEKYIGTRELTNVYWIAEAETDDVDYIEGGDRLGNTYDYPELSIVSEPPPLSKEAQCQ